MIFLANFSKSGRPPLKKLSERKMFTRPGKMPAGSTPDFSGTLLFFM